MKITQLNKEAEKLPGELKNPILALIELKTDSDMEKVLDKMTGIEQRFESKITGVLDKMTDIEQRLESKMDIQFNRIDALFRMLLWGIGIAFTLIAVLITIYKFL